MAWAAGINARFLLLIERGVKGIKSRTHSLDRLLHGVERFSISSRRAVALAGNSRGQAAATISAALAEAVRKSSSSPLKNLEIEALLAVEGPCLS